VFFSSCIHRENGIPLPEHPRPDFERPTWQNLNGYWNFKSDSANVGLNENWQLKTETFDRKILVPFSWASPLSEIELPDVHVGWYSKTIKIENHKNWVGKNTWLVFCASDFNTTIWLNGEKIGHHSGGYVPFEFDITEYVNEEENQLVVRVEDEELDNRPSGKQYYGNAKGIWQTVYLEARPKNFIQTIRFTPDIDNQTVKTEVTLSGKISSDAVFSVIGKNTPIVLEEKIKAGSSKAHFTIPVPDMKLWDLENPFLYDVTVNLKTGDENDVLSTYFGMRKISAVHIPGQDFQYVALNNNPLYLKMALDQSYHPRGFYTFPSDQFMKEEIQRAKDIGLNGLRIHIKAEVPRKLYWADKLGLLIQEDIPNFWGEPDSIARANWEYIAEKEIERDYNHPSVFSWVLFNETWGLFTKDSVSGERKFLPETQDWVRSLYHKTKEYDPTRLVEDNSPCNWDHVITDINTWHAYIPARNWGGFMDEIVENTYPGSGHNFIGDNKQGNQPMFNSECGAVWGYSGSTGDIDITWEYHIKMNEFRKRPKIAGFIFTEFHDVVNEWNGYYRFDRSKKKFGLNELVSGMSINDFHSDLYVVAGEDFYNEYQTGTSTQIPIGINAVTYNIPADLKINYSLYGWNELGEKIDFEAGEMKITAEPFVYKNLVPIQFTTPNQNTLMILATFLEDGKGNVLHRNFVPFRVSGQTETKKLIISQPPSSFEEADWSIKHKITQKGRKVWGMGSGYFEYTFILPDSVSEENLENIEFRAELASRYPQEKYLEEGDAEKIGMTIVSQKGTIPGYGKNSYPQTDQKLHSSIVTITANNQLLDQFELTDDPADHNGLLSWMNQEPGWLWGSTQTDKPWLLDEAGSYGFLVKVSLDENSKKSALETKTITIRMYVDESSKNRGGLSVYGKHSGKYPLDPSIIIQTKQ
jgi:hypothetical protein